MKSGSFGHHEAERASQGELPMSSRLGAFSALAMSLSLFLPTTLYAQSSFVDHRGKTITFQKPPQRVVTIVRSAPIIYRAVDEKAGNIVGMNKDSSVRYFTSGIYAEMLPEMAKINASAAQDGFVPNVEAILAEKPDAVIQWTHDEKIIEPLERVGLDSRRLAVLHRARPPRLPDPDRLHDRPQRSRSDDPEGPVRHLEVARRQGRQVRQGGTSHRPSHRQGG